MLLLKLWNSYLTVTIILIQFNEAIFPCEREGFIKQVITNLLSDRILYQKLCFGTKKAIESQSIISLLNFVTKFSLA